MTWAPRACEGRVETEAPYEKAKRIPFSLSQRPSKLRWHMFGRHPKCLYKHLPYPQPFSPLLLLSKAQNPLHHPFQPQPSPLSIPASPRTQMGFPSITYGILVPQPLVELLDLWAQLKLMVRLALFYLGLFDPTDQSSSWNDYGQWTIEHPPQLSLQVTPDSIKKRLAIVEFSDAGEDETICAVCLSGVEVGHEIRELRNCSHVFHVGCLDKWVDQGQVTCPMCRSKLLPQRDEKKGGPHSWLVDRISYLFGEDLMRDGY